MDQPSRTPVGLTSEQVRQRKLHGQVNAVKLDITKPLSRILIDNICTFFNLFNVIIFVALLLIRSYHNLLFFFILLINTAVGILQELRSKRTLEKLSVLSSAKAKVVRDGQRCEIPVTEIVLGDTILFEAGDQISVDAIVDGGEAELNESLLTGEPDTITKQTGDHLLSGSFIVSGQCVATVEHIGEDNYAARLSKEAKKYRRIHSDLMISINKIIRFTGSFLLPFGALLVLREVLSGDFDLTSTITSTAAALLGMMPQGLVLLTTVALVVGVLKLAKKHTLVQELHCIETLSRVDTLCLDKTGTLTKGSMTLTQLLPQSEQPLPLPFNTLVLSALDAIGDNNATAAALRAYFSDRAQPQALPVRERCAFSSQRKWSAVSFEKLGTVFFGAYDRLLPTAELPAALQQTEREGKRLLLIAFSEQDTVADAADSLVPLAVAVLEDEMRENIEDTLRFFQEQEVEVKIISGDHPLTVSAIAQKAGVPHAACYVDAGTLTTEQALADAAQRYTVFGRVLPAQKKQLVEALKAQGHTVAMTGDGVNDVPALKAADCSIAVAAGSDAAKQVSQLVLLDSDFGSLPSVVMEGRRVINNITRTASLFLVKTVMSFLITLCTILLPMSYPFEPIQLSLLGMFAESIPGFFLTLEPSRERVKDHFLQTVLCNALPSGLLITVFIVLIELLIAPLVGFSQQETSTLCVYVTAFVWLIQLWRVCHPLTHARRLLWGLMTVGMFGGELLLALVFPTLLRLFGQSGASPFLFPTLPMLLIFALFAVLTCLLDKPLYQACHRLLFRKKTAAA